MSEEPFISWKPEFSVDNDAIDGQHQALVGLIRQFQEAMWEGRGRTFQSTLIDRLVSYTRVHFAFEEEMLAACGYEFLAEHAEQHRILTAQVHDLQARVRAGTAVSNAALMVFLRTWLTGHILEHDHKYASALNAGTKAGAING